MGRREHISGRLALAMVFRLAAPVFAVALLSGCGMISHKFSEITSQAPGIGLPADAPERPTEQAPYPAVHDLPPPRDTSTLTAVERAQAEKDLLEARNEQQSASAVIKTGSDDPRAPKLKEQEEREKIQKEKLRKARSSQASQSSEASQ
jgi:hypothetical protein